MIPFKNSGLPDIPLVKDAYKYTSSKLAALESEVVLSKRNELEGFYQQTTMIIEKKFELGKLTEAEYESNKEELESMVKRQRALLPMLARHELDDMFQSEHIGPALEYVKNVDKPNPDVIAAILIFEVIRSPHDMRDLLNNYGDDVASLIADVKHLDLYPANREKNFAAMSDDAKRVMMSFMASNITLAVAAIGERLKRRPTDMPSLAYGQEQEWFENIRSVWGVEPKMDQLILDNFNALAKLTRSSYSIEITPEGKPELVRNAFKPPVPPKLLGPGNKPPKPPGGGSFGGDVF